MLFPFKFLRNALLTETIKEKISYTFFKIASYLTDPICKAHEYFRLISINQTLYFKKGLLSLALISNTTLALFTTLPGAAIRACATSIQTQSHTYLKGEAQEKTLPRDQTFSVLSWNVCCIAGGFSISDGGVAPWHQRIDPIIEKILSKDADVNCLFETFDTSSATRIAQKLKQNGYTHIYYNISPRAFGVSSGILIASKYAIDSPEFIAFPKETLVGRTRGANKGAFAFNLTSENKPFARIYATHLQHSEQPAFPTPDEVWARKMQMELIVKKMQTNKNLCTILTGDLNLDEEEYQNSSWHKYFVKEENLKIKTWGGDQFCAKLMGKEESKPLNLDYLLVIKGSAKALTSTIVEAQYNQEVYSHDALSDHHGLYNKVKVHRRK